jgi:hypothetical protein
MTLPGDQPSPWSREGDWISQNQPDQLPSHKPDPQFPQYPPPPAADPPPASYPQPQLNPLPGLYPPPAPYQPPPRRRRTGLWVALGVVAAVLVGLAMWGVIADNRAHPAGSGSGSRQDPVTSGGTTKVVTATDQKSQLTVPLSWNDVPASFKSDLAKIQVGDLRREQYVLVTTANTADFEDFTAFTDATIQAVRGLVDGAEVGEPRPLTMNGQLNAVRYQVTGNAAGVKAVFWYTLIEGKRGFYGVLGWTLPSLKSEAEPVILTVVDSFRELGAG